MIRVILFLLISFLLSFSNISAQSDVIFNHLTIDDGLSQSSVTCILQDKNGFMWFGTQDGLNRFDGYNFKIFKNNPGDSSSLTNNFIFSIIEDQSGTLYIETQGGDFHVYNPRSESFQTIDGNQIDFEKAKISTVGALLYEPNGIKWVGGLSKGTGLERIDTKSGKSKVFKHNPADPSSLSDDKVYSIFRDRSGNLWIGTFNGLDRLNEQTEKFIHYRNNPNDPTSLSDNWVWPIFEDSRGCLWLGTVRGGLSKFDPKTNSVLNYKNDPNDQTSINDNFVFSLYEDRGGVIWIGTNLSGINYFNPSTQSFEHYKNEPENKNSLSDNTVNGILADRNGDYWIATRYGGLNKFDYNKKKFSSYSHNPSNPNSILSNSIQSLLEDRSGNIWIGTYSSGLNILNPETGLFTQYTNNPSDPNSLSDDRIYSLAEDKKGTIWVGTYGGGLNKLDRSTGKFFRYQFNENDSASISSNATWSLALDDYGNLWIGTFGGGVNVLNLQDQKFTYYKNNPEDSTSIVDDNIISIFKDSKGNMWIGTTKGFCRYLKETNSFKNYNEENGLANNFVYGILEGINGNLWISTNNGLSKFNPEKESFKNYYAQDGLQGNEFNQNAFAKDYKTGRLFFGGVNGFNVFNPDKVRGNTFVPPVVYTNYIRYNSDDEEGKPIFEKGISVRDSILVTYKDNIVTFQFAALSYYNSFDNQYRYKLEGFNENWIQLGNNHSVTFTNLSPGDYKLIVTGSNNDELWNDEGRSLFIEVMPPWWRTNIAYAIYIITFFSLLYGVRRVEINRREQKTKLRENELRLKATEAEKRAIQIENDRKTKELEEARALQLSMLPKELPKLPNLQIAAFMRTATEVGGDYYDFIEQENGVLNIAFGDATGHGLQAGTMVTLMKGFFTSDSSKLGLKEFMSHCSRVIKDIKLGRILMSFSYLKIESNKLFVTSGGMPPIYYHNKETNQVEEILIQGMPLGAMRNASYNVIEKEIKSGDTILLLTDGLPEQMNSNEEMFDYSRVKSSFNDAINNKPDEIIDKLVKAGDNWMNGRIQDDDITFVVIRAN
ncbi:MAG: SpoIIE family protein phosphatase [Ignavibacteriaceae bacterium]|jgi:ligand-binding sensor domain-containing protein/serine phosphatase RsbU (regulator of sigma subunit)|nr:SpoIIE family protein phosphatase [Ignavibacteriaceae bacterium]